MDITQISNDALYKMLCERSEGLSDILYSLTHGSLPLNLSTIGKPTQDLLVVANEVADRIKNNKLPLVIRSTNIPLPMIIEDHHIQFPSQPISAKPRPLPMIIESVDPIAQFRSDID